MPSLTTYLALAASAAIVSAQGGVPDDQTEARNLTPDCKLYLV
jgi:hypothetical protein